MESKNESVITLQIFVAKRPVVLIGNGEEFSDGICIRSQFFKEFEDIVSKVFELGNREPVSEVFSIGKDLRFEVNKMEFVVKFLDFLIMNGVQKVVETLGKIKLMISFYHFSN